MAMLRPFVFIRHGETDWNKNGWFQGRSDVSLNETGRRQACAAAQEIASLSVSKVLVSPLKRAIETANLVFPASPDLIEIETDLIECDFGSLEGTSIRDAMREHGITRKEQLAEILPPDGEPWTAVLSRCRLLLDRLAVFQEVDPYIVLIGHDAVFQGISETLTGRWFDSKHGQPYYFRLDVAGWKIAEKQNTDAPGLS